jgi:hypothetical protein
MVNTTSNQFKGMLLEMAVSQALDILGIQHSHNNWNNYAKEQGGVDIITSEYLIECKNWTHRTNIDMETLMNEVVARFWDSDCKNMLVISCLGSILIERLNKLNIQTVVLNLDVTPNNYSLAVKILILKLKPFFSKEGKQD